MKTGERDGWAMQIRAALALLTSARSKLPRVCGPHSCCLMSLLAISAEFPVPAILLPLGMSRADFNFTLASFFLNPQIALLNKLRSVSSLSAALVIKDDANPSQSIKTATCSLRGRDISSRTRLPVMRHQ